MLTLPSFSAPGHADDLDNRLREAPWAEIGATAKRLIDQESPDGVWPFRRESHKGPRV
jgi:hypothetical protein